MMDRAPQTASHDPDRHSRPSARRARAAELLAAGALALLPGVLRGATPVETEDVKLVASGAGAEQDFGRAVAASGDRIVVGDPFDDEVGYKAGAAYVFERDGVGTGAWVQAARIQPDDTERRQEFGMSVAIAGHTLLVGAPRDDHAGEYAGAAYVFKKDAGGTDAWGQVARLTAFDAAAGDEFGAWVAISGDTAVVAAPEDSHAEEEAGSIYIFERNLGGTDAWGLRKKLTAPVPVHDGYFGFGVDISGDTIAVGAWGEDDACPSDPYCDSGAIYIFERDQGGEDGWGSTRRIIDEDGDEQDNLGWCVGLSGDTLAGGSALWALIFERDEGGPDAWGKVTEVRSSDFESGDYFSNCLDLSGDLMLAGAKYDDSDRGSAYVFQRDLGGDDAWGELAKLTASDRAPGDVLGEALAISGGAAVVGAPGEDQGGNSAGAAYVFEVRDSPAVSVSGACPGEATITVTGATPNGSVSVWTSADEGSSTIASGTCAGTELTLTGPRVLRTLTADGSGQASFTRSAGLAACGRFVQAVDAATCATSALATIP